MLYFPAIPNENSDAADIIHDVFFLYFVTLQGFQRIAEDDMGLTNEL
jgi:hypothetical protein